MKTFEERYTAWVDGKLDPEQLAQFEQELTVVPDAAADRSGAASLGSLLRKYGPAPELQGAEFFNHQLLQRLGENASRTARGEQRSWWRWSIPQLAWSGAACLLLAFALFKTMVTTPPAAGISTAPYFAEVVDVWPADPTISVSTVYNPRDNVTVLWLDGLDYLPASYVLQ